MNAEHWKCTLEEYHAHPAWSHSQIEDLIDSPPLFYGRHVAKPPIFPRKHSAEFDVGTVAHAVLCEPNGLAEVVRVIPEDVLNDSGHRKGSAWKAWSEENAGFIQLKSDELDPILHMTNNVRAACPAWITDGPGHHEYSIRWTDEATGLMLRARPDRICLRDDGETAVVVDWKTTRSHTPRSFSKDMLDFGYHRQAAWYWEAAERMGWSIAAFLFVCVDKTPAHECRIYEVDAPSLVLGRQQNAKVLHELAWRLESNNWQAADHGVILTLGLPDYAYREDQWSIQ